MDDHMNVVAEDPHTAVRKEEDPKDTSEMKPLIVEMDKDIKMMAGSVKYMAEDMRVVNKAMDFMKGNMKHGMKGMMKPMREAIREVEYMKDDIKNMMSNVKFLGEATDYNMGDQDMKMTRRNLEGMNKAVGNMNSYMGYVRDAIDNLSKSMADMDKAMKNMKKRATMKLNVNQDMGSVT